MQMTKNPFKFIFHLFMYALYRGSMAGEWSRYYAAKEKGYYCTGLKHGAAGTIAEFDKTRKPQEKPTAVPFKQAMINMNS